MVARKVTPAPVVLCGSTAIETVAGQILFGPVPEAVQLSGTVPGLTFRSALRLLVDLLLADGDEALDFIQGALGAEGAATEVIRSAFEDEFSGYPAGFFDAVLKCMVAAGLVGTSGSRLWPPSKAITDTMLWRRGDAAPHRIFPGGWEEALIELARRAPRGETLPLTAMPKHTRRALHRAAEHGWSVSTDCPVRGPKYRGIRLAIE